VLPASDSVVGIREGAEESIVECPAGWLHWPAPRTKLSVPSGYDLAQVTQVVHDEDPDAAMHIDGVVFRPAPEPPRRARQRRKFCALPSLDRPSGP
jgi:hypothetical protein